MSSMQISRETDYAIRCVLYLAKSYDEIVDVNEIADAREIPKSFLSKILQKLAKVNIVQSYRGLKGGFRLSRRPKDISLLDVIEVIEPVALNRCAVNLHNCNQSKTCYGHLVWMDVRNDLKQRLKQYNFENLINQAGA